MKFILLFFLFFSCIKSFNQTNKIRLEINVNSSFEGKIIVSTPYSGLFPNDSVILLEKGKYYYESLFEEEISSCNVILYTKDDTSNLFFFVDTSYSILNIYDLNNQKQKCNIQFFNLPFMDEQVAFLKFNYKSEESYSSLESVMYKLKKVDSTSVEYWKAKKDFEDAFVNLRQCRLKFYKAYPNSYLSGYYFFRDWWKPNFYDGINEDSLYKNLIHSSSPYLKSLHYYFENLLYLYENKYVEGAIVENFGFITLEDKLTTIKKIATKKYILITFWTSGFDRSLEHLDLVKKKYLNYEDSVVLLNINSDSEYNWKKYFENNVLQGVNTNNHSEYLSKKDNLFFNGSMVPSAYLLNNDLTIIVAMNNRKTYSKSIETFFKRLDAMFLKN
jgi:hypothetical protein